MPTYEGLRSRDELLATRMMSADEFLDATEAYGPNGFVHPRESLSPIAVVLRPDESADDYEWSFLEWLEQQELTLSMLQSDPEEERRLRQCFVYSRVQGAASEGSSGRKRRRVTANDEMRVEESEHEEKLQPQCSCDLGRQLTEMEGRLLAQLAELQQELRSLKQGKKTQAAQKSEREGGVRVKEKDSASLSSSRDTCSVAIKNEEISHPARNANIVKTATELMSRAMRLETDAAQERLVQAYTRLNEKVLQMKTKIQASDSEHTSTEASEVRNQITVEEGRRDAALAGVVAHEWRGRQYELYQAFDQPEFAEEEGDMHQRLAEVYQHTKQIRTEMQALQVKLRNRLSWLKGVDVNDTERTSQFEELQGISNALSAKFVLMSRAQDQRRVLCVKMLQSNEAIRTRVIRLLDSGHT